MSEDDLALKRGALIVAWKAWDAAPGADRQARTLTDACIEYARAIGVTYPELRRRLSAGARAGIDYRTTLITLESH